MSRSPERLQFDNSIFVREEANGTTVHEVEANTHKFFEDVPVREFTALESRDEVSGMVAHLEQQGRMNRNIELTHPMRVNWLGSLACNLVCVYCYAEDKMDQKRATAPEVFDTIDELSPLAIGITGGEPLMSPYLTEAIERFSGHYGLIVDTNGTVRPRPELLEAMKDANATVRVTIDATEKSVLNMLRPSRSGREYDPEKIMQTLHALGEAGINTAVHSVMTSQNVDRLDEVGDRLVDMGIESWQVYPVEYTKKYRASYPFLRVETEKIDETRERLKGKFGDSMEVRVYGQRESVDDRSVVMIENNGDVILDRIDHGVERIHPGEGVLERVMDTINVQQHVDDYLYERP
jgi:MoaA/NifB/PqqE/SkfB family radical SAM enzyme